MKIGSSSDSIYQLFLPRSKTEAASDSGAEQFKQPLRTSGVTSSDDSLVAAFQARLAESSFNRNDTNGDGFVDREEYIDNNLQERADGYKPELADVQSTWNQIDANGKGRLSEDEYKEGFNSILKVSMGHFDKPIR
ncbi:EF-hand domain-containing protein [Pararhizobium arenae]|uniref:EF-hand domain-containing protein n=1 Tax=Pararhizobium arenae TaxID=1856850 RepID=UPI00094B78F4|nr:EF-hand domain-containing protein [Pararhizobium arenae]